MADVVAYRKRSLVSLLMLLLALGLGAGGYALTNLNQYQELPADAPVALGVWVGLGLLAWGVTAWRLPYADPLLIPCVFALNGLGIAMIYRLDQATDPPMQSGRLQLMWAVASVAALCVVLLVLRDHRRLQRYTYVWFAAGLALLLLPLLPVLGVDNNGARIWIRIGQFSFQPAEIAKIVLSIAFAAYLTEKRDVLALAGHRFLGIDLPRARDLGPILIMWGASLIVLVFQKDLGTTLLFFGLFVMMLYVATERPSWVVLGVLMITALGLLGFTLFDHVQVRFESWLNPFENYDQNLQVISAQFGFAWGGLFGTGWGLGRPYLTPLAKNDFIAAAVGEELGLFGFCALVLLFAIIVARVLRAALAAREPFGKLLAAGLAFVFALQVFVILGGVTRLLPLTGLTTPFVSQGGSSLISNYVLLGLMLTITHHVRRPQAGVSDDEYASLAADSTQPMAAASAAAAPALAPRPDPAVVTPDDSPTELVALPPAAPTVGAARPATTGGASAWSALVDAGEPTQALDPADVPRGGVPDYWSTPEEDPR